MTLWHWAESQGIPGLVLGSWIASIPIGHVIKRVTERRHRERVAATERHTEALHSFTAALAAQHQEK